MAPSSDHSHPSAPPAPLNRSCENCRNLKVRCLPDPAVPHQCQRCNRTRRTCVFATTLRRQPRKKTGSRVAQLEKDVRDLRLLLRDQAQTENPVRLDNKASLAGTTQETIPSHVETLGYRQDAASPTLSSSTMTGSGDVIDRGVISMDTAQMLVSVFINDLIQFFPVVVLAPDVDVQTLRRARPVLFLSVLAASSLTLDTPQSAVLNEELLKLYSEKFFMRGEKSLELIQAMLLMLIFYFPPKTPLNGQYYQYTHIATTMVLELGLAAGTAGRKNYRCHEEYGELPSSIHSDQARAVLGCYHFASNIGIRTHRPNMLCFNGVINGYINHLSKSSNIMDQQIATWFGLQRILDETLASLGHENTLGGTSFVDSQMLPILKWFDTRMVQWKKSTPESMLTTWMTLEYHYMYLAIYELAAGEGYRDPDAASRKYYTLPPLEGNVERHKANMPLSAARVHINTKWMLAAQQLLDAFLHCNIQTMRNMPNMTYTRMVVGVSTLLRIYHTAQLGPLGEVISPQMINVDGYLDRFSRTLLSASGDQKYRIPSRWYHVVGVKNRDWYELLQRRLNTRQVESVSYSGAARGGIAPFDPLPDVSAHAIRRTGQAIFTAPLWGGNGYVGARYAEDSSTRIGSSKPFAATNTSLLGLSSIQEMPPDDVQGGAYHEDWGPDECPVHSTDVPFPY